MHTKDTLTGQSLALATGWSRGVTTLSGRKAPMSRLRHTVNKKTRTARAQRRRDVTAHSDWDQSQERQTWGAPLPTALCESSRKGTKESTRQRGQSGRKQGALGVRIEAEDHPVAEPGLSRGEGPERGQGVACRDSDTAARPTE